MANRRLKFILIWNTAAVVVLLLVTEVALGWLLHHPPAVSSLVERLRAYYMEHDRRIAQYDARCGLYDSRLSYTLRPGVCRFANPEFSVELAVNRSGLRDNETALVSPEIIVIGDSQAMGWAVAADETFAHLLRKWSGRRVLNGGVPSYGTVRQMRLLERLDTRRMKWLVLQYSPNDWPENRLLVEKGTLEIMGEASYDALVAA